MKKETILLLFSILLFFTIVIVIGNFVTEDYLYRKGQFYNKANIVNA